MQKWVLTEMDKNAENGVYNADCVYWANTGVDG